MSSHGVVRVMDRLVSIALIALLVGPGLPACGPGSSCAPKAAAAGDGGMNAVPVPISPALSAAAPTVAVPVATATRVVFFDCSLRSCGRTGDRVLRPSTALPSAPTILRI
jgi:hypothetical protein